MRFSLVLFGLVAVASTPALCEDAGTLHGEWTGTAKGQGGGELSVELQLTESGGFWRFVRQGNKGKNNPCLGVDFPVTVTSQSATELVINVEGSKVLQGCMNEAVTFKTTDGKTLQGAMADGRPVSLSRQ